MVCGYQLPECSGEALCFFTHVCTSVCCAHMGNLYSYVRYMMQDEKA